MPGKRQPGQGATAQRQAGNEVRRQDDGAAPGPRENASAGETAAQILRNDQQSPRSRAAARVGLTAAVIAGVAVAAGIAGLSLLANSGGGNGGAARSGRSRAQAGQAVAVSGPPLRIVSESPPARSQGVSADTTVRIVFSAKLAPTSAMPTFHPAVAGRWRASGRVLSFTPSAPFAPWTRYTLIIPAGKSGLRSASGGAIGKPTIIRFRTAGYSRLVWLAPEPRLHRVAVRSGPARLAVPDLRQPGDGRRLTHVTVRLGQLHQALMLGRPDPLIVFVSSPDLPTDYLQSYLHSLVGKRWYRSGHIAGGPALTPRTQKRAGRPALPR